MAKVKDWAMDKEEERMWYHEQAKQYMSWLAAKRPAVHEKIVSGEIPFRRSWLRPFPGKQKASTD